MTSAVRNTENKGTSAVAARRGSVLVEETEIIEQQVFAASQFVLRVRAPRIAEQARPGSFTHICCDPRLPMRRPLSIMRATPGGELEFYYKILGHGLELLSQRKVGETLNMMGPIGQPFEAHPQRPWPLLIGGGVGIPPMLFLAESLAHDDRADWQPLVLMGAEIPFPFNPRTASVAVPGMLKNVTAAMPLVDDWGLASRLAAGFEATGCYRGHVTNLARHWLKSLSRTDVAKIEVFACGPTPMLLAAASVAREFQLPCQVSLEEFMACGIGGCAGCTVQVRTDEGLAMKRVCVDGPVFDAYSVYTE